MYYCIERRSTRRWLRSACGLQRAFSILLPYLTPFHSILPFRDSPLVADYAILLLLLILCKVYRSIGYYLLEENDADYICICIFNLEKHQAAQSLKKICVFLFPISGSKVSHTTQVIGKNRSVATFCSLSSNVMNI